MEKSRTHCARQGRRSGPNSGQQSLVSGGSAVDWANWLPVARFAGRVRSVAHGVHAFLPMATQRRLAACGPGCGGGDGDRTHTDRFDHRRGAPAFRGGIKKSGLQALGRSRGGLSTRLHLAVDAEGRPLRLVITAGQIHDVSCADELIDRLRVGAIIADKGYDADTFVKKSEPLGRKH